MIFLSGRQNAKCSLLIKEGEKGLHQLPDFHFLELFFKYFVCFMKIIPLSSSKLQIELVIYKNLDHA